MNERLLEAKKNAEKFKEYLQSDSKKEVRKFAEELITHKDNIDFVSILEDALTLYDFIVWKKESVPAETQVSQPSELTCEKLCKNCKCFKRSQDYNNVGDCEHPKFSDGIIFSHCDDMYVSEDFGCINFEQP